MSQSSVRRAIVILALCGMSSAYASPTAAAPPDRCQYAICATNFVFLSGLQGPAMSVAAGGNSVWALDDVGSVYRFNASSLQFDRMPGSLAWISVGGGNLVSEDAVWGGTSDNRIFSWYSSPLNHWVEMSHPVDDPIRSVTVGRGHNIDNNCSFAYSEVWGLSSNGNVYRYCLGWRKIAAPPLTAISIGNGEIWGLDASNQVYRFDVGPAAFQTVPGALNRLAVGIDGVWGILDRTPVNTGAIERIGPGNPFAPQVFQFDAASKTLVEIPNAQMKAISAGANGVWALDGAQSVWRLQALTRKFIKVPNVTLRTLSVGSGTGVWGIDQNHQIRAFVTPARLLMPLKQ